MIAVPKFYTYIHMRADDGSVFYVGKGTGNRVLARGGRSTHWHRIVAKHGLRTEIVARWDREADAFDHEKSLIAQYRSRGLPLCNLSDGGDGFAEGHPVSEETRAKIAAGHIGKKNGADARAKISAANRGLVRSAEVRARISAGLIGRPVSAETRAKMSAAQKGRTITTEHRERISKSLTGRRLTELERERMRPLTHGPEWRAKHSTAMKGRPWSEARRAAHARSET